MEKIATEIESWLIENKLTSDVRIYFNNKAWEYKRGQRIQIDDIKGSDYFEYANDDTISMSFEGELYDVLNYGCDDKRWDELEMELNNLIKNHGYYFELGNAWNLALAKI